MKTQKMYGNQKTIRRPARARIQWLRILESGEWHAKIDFNDSNADRHRWLVTIPAPNSPQFIDEIMDSLEDAIYARHREEYLAISPLGEIPLPPFGLNWKTSKRDIALESALTLHWLTSEINEFEVCIAGKKTITLACPQCQAACALAEDKRFYCPEHGTPKISPQMMRALKLADEQMGDVPKVTHQENLPSF